MDVVADTGSDERADSPSVGAMLGEFEIGVIDLFVSAVRLLGMPKSIGEIYGLLFTAAEPLALDGIMSRLQMSKGSASQGLKFLRNVGAVRPVYVAGERRDHFEAVIELKPLVAGFIRKELVPQMELGSVRLGHLATMVEADPDAGELAHHRLGRLQQWNRSAQEFLPLVNAMIDQISSEDDSI